VGGIRILGVVLTLVVTEGFAAMTCEILLIVPPCCAEKALQPLEAEWLNRQFPDIVVIEQEA
jgi:hypothetical protein